MQSSPAFQETCSTRRRASSSRDRTSFTKSADRTRSRSSVVNPRSSPKNSKSSRLSVFQQPCLRIRTSILKSLSHADPPGFSTPKPGFSSTSTLRFCGQGLHLVTEQMEVWHFCLIWANYCRCHHGGIRRIPHHPAGRSVDSTADGGLVQDKSASLNSIQAE